MFIPEEILPENISVKWGKEYNIDMKNIPTHDITVSAASHAPLNGLHRAEPAQEQPGLPAGCGHGHEQAMPIAQHRSHRPWPAHPNRAGGEGCRPCCPLPGCPGASLAVPQSPTPAIPGHVLPSGPVARTEGSMMQHGVRLCSSQRFLTAL